MRIALAVLLALGGSVGLCAAEIENVTVSWIGNTFPYGGGQGSQHKWVPQDASDIFVASDGTVYTNVFWEEGSANQTAIKDGDVLAQARGSRGWGHEGGESVTANSKYLYYAQIFDNEGGGLKDPNNWPPKGSKWFGVSRRNRTNIRAGDVFEGGKGGRECPKACFLPVHETDKNANITGLHASEEELFVASAFDDTIRVYDANTMAAKRKWTVEKPQRVFMDRDGALWVIHGDGVKIGRFDRDGKKLPQEIVLKAPSRASDLCVDKDNRLLVADCGPENVVRIHEEIGKTPREVKLVGTPGGIFAGTPGRFGDLRFNRIAGVGTDDQGNIYVASTQRPSSGVIIESYSPALKLNWRVMGLEFVDRIAEDPGNHASLFSKETRYALDWSKPAGQEWSYRGLTLHPQKYPHDPRLTLDLCSPLVQRVEGKPFLFLNGQNEASPLAIYRFDEKTDGEIAIPCGLINKKKSGKIPGEPAKGEYLWIDANGDGQFDAGEFAAQGEKEGPWAGGVWIDTKGAIWFACGGSIRRFACQGLNGKGVPKYDFQHCESFPCPAPLKAARRVRYDPETDTLYAGGTNEQYKNRHWKPMGPVLSRYDHWSKGNRDPKWTVIGTHDQDYKGGHSSCEPIAFDVAGDYVFVSLAGASGKLGVRMAEVDVYEAATGKHLGRLKPTRDFGEAGLMDMVECIRAFKRADGEYVVIIEEDYAAKNIVYRWRP